MEEAKTKVYVVRIETDDYEAVLKHLYESKDVIDIDLLEVYDE